MFQRVRPLQLLSILYTRHFFEDGGSLVILNCLRMQNQSLFPLFFFLHTLYYKRGDLISKLL